MSPFDQFRFHLLCAITHTWKAGAALWCSRARELALWILVGTFGLLLLTGCIHGPRVSIPDNGFLAGGEATAPKNNGTPATVASSGEETRMEVPAGSTVTETTTAAVPAVPATADTPAQPAQPLTVVREVHLSAPTAIVQKAQHVQTSTGTIDTAVALSKVQAAESRWLLWAAIGCGIGGLVVKSMLPAWPALSNGLLAGAVLAFAAWKFSAVPAWAFALAIGLTVALALGYKRAEWDKDGNGIPDLLEKKTPPTS